MKTLEYVQQELQDAIKLGETGLSKKEAKVCEKRIKHLYSCRLYLETNPTQEFVQKQFEDVKRKIKIINSGFHKWLQNNQKEADGVANPKSKYNTLMGLKNLKAQLNTLDYLLG